MSKLVFTDCFVTVNAVDLKSYTSKVELSAEIEEQDVTTFASGGWKEVIGGLAEGSISFSFKNDFAAAQLDSIMWPLFIARSVVPFELRPTSAAVGTSNPKYTGNLLVNKWDPISGDVGDVAEVDVEYPVSGVVVRSTS